MSSIIKQNYCYDTVMNRLDLAQLFKNVSQKEQVSQSELARRTNRSRAYVSQVFTAAAGITFDEILTWLEKLDHDMFMVFEHKKKNNKVISLVQTLTTLSDDQLEIVELLLNGLPRMNDAAKEGVLGLLQAYSKPDHAKKKQDQPLLRQANLK